MNSTTLQRIARRASTLTIGLMATLCLSTSVGNAQTTIQLTNFDGTVLPAHAHLYTVYRNCFPNHCEWYLRKLYGDNAAVVVTIKIGSGDPACYSGFTQYIVSGYTRSACTIYVSAAIYGT